MSRLPSGYKRARFLDEREWFISVRNDGHARCPECSGLTARGPGLWGPADVEHRSDCARYPSRLQRERAEADALAEREKAAWSGLGLEGRHAAAHGRLLSISLDDAEALVERLKSTFNATQAPSRKGNEGDPMTGHDFTEFAARLRALASTGHHARQLRRLADDVDATGVVLGLLSPPMIVEPVGSARRSALLDAIVVMCPAKE